MSKRNFGESAWNIVSKITFADFAMAFGCVVGGTFLFFAVGSAFTQLFNPPSPEKPSSLQASPVEKVIGLTRKVYNIDYENPFNEPGARILAYADRYSEKYVYFHVSNESWDDATIVVSGGGVLLDGYLGKPVASKTMTIKGGAESAYGLLNAPGQQVDVYWGKKKAAHFQSVVWNVNYDSYLKDDPGYEVATVDWGNKLVTVPRWIPDTTTGLKYVILAFNEERLVVKITNLRSGGTSNAITVNGLKDWRNERYKLLPGKSKTFEVRPGQRLPFSQEGMEPGITACGPEVWKRQLPLAILLLDKAYDGSRK